MAFLWAPQGVHQDLVSGDIDIDVSVFWLVKTIDFIFLIIHGSFHFPSFYHFWYVLKLPPALQHWNVLKLVETENQSFCQICLYKSSENYEVSLGSVLKSFKTSLILVVG